MSRRVPRRRLRGATVPAARRGARANGMWCDSSVYHGGRRRGRPHVYAHPFDSHQPWFASHGDPQLKAPPAEQGIVELPVATFARNDRWMFDAEEGARFGERLLAVIEADRTAGPSTEVARAHREGTRTRRLGYYSLRAHIGAWSIACCRDASPMTLVDYPRERLTRRRLLRRRRPLEGRPRHSRDPQAVADAARRRRRDRRIAQMARTAREQLERGRSAPRRRQRGAAQRVDRERNEAQSQRLQGMIPLDRARLLDLGCGPARGPRESLRRIRGCA